MKSRSDRTSGPRLVAGNLLVFLLFFSLASLCGEIYFRYIYDTTDSFLYTLTSKRWHERYYHENAQGFRDEVDYQPQIPRGKRRVAFLGDSFTAGHGIKNVADRFANLIRGSRPEWDVQIAAELGADSGRELEMLKTLIGRYQLDQVVLIYVMNDIADITPEMAGIDAAAVGDNPFSPNWLVENSYFANAMYYRLMSRFNPYILNYCRYVLAAYRGPLWEAQKDRLRSIRSLVESNGGRLSVVTFPFLHAPLDGAYEYAFVHEGLKEFWREENVPHLDLLPTYQGLPPHRLVVNPLDAHPGEFAHKLAASAIEKFLRGHLETPSAS